MGKEPETKDKWTGDWWRVETLREIYQEPRLILLQEPIELWKAVYVTKDKDRARARKKLEIEEAKKRPYPFGALAVRIVQVSFIPLERTDIPGKRKELEEYEEKYQIRRK